MCTRACVCYAPSTCWPLCELHCADLSTDMCLVLATGFIFIIPLENIRKIHILHNLTTSMMRNDHSVGGVCSDGSTPHTYVLGTECNMSYSRSGYLTYFKLLMAPKTIPNLATPQWQCETCCWSSTYPVVPQHLEKLMFLYFCVQTNQTCPSVSSMAFFIWWTKSHILIWLP